MSNSSNHHPSNHGRYHESEIIHHFQSSDVGRGQQVIPTHYIRKKKPTDPISTGDIVRCETMGSKCVEERQGLATLSCLRTTLRGIHSVAMFCIVFFLKCRLPIRLHSSHGALEPSVG